MATEIRDNVATTAAIGLLAYLSADVAHHAFGHGGACLAMGGRIVSLSSIFVDCTLKGSPIDLAGPLANLVLGLSALVAARGATRRASQTRLFLLLVAAFNLMWFALQLAFSAATRTDDWAWPMHELHIGEPVRYAMVGLGIVGLLLTNRAIASLLAPFANTLARARTIVLAAWITAGATAVAIAMFDHHAIDATVHHALPQSLALSAGLLFVPAKAAKLASAGEPAPAIALSVLWIVAAATACTASIALLGPGFSIAL